ncbi:MAG: hypothetical protein ABL888_20125 [Pirellulaceae bacterium]
MRLRLAILCKFMFLGFLMPGIVVCPNIRAADSTQEKSQASSETEGGKPVDTSKKDEAPADATKEGDVSAINSKKTYTAEDSHKKVGDTAEPVASEDPILKAIQNLEGKIDGGFSDLKDLPQHVKDLQASFLTLDGRVKNLELKPGVSPALGVRAAAAAVSLPTVASTPARKVHFLIFSLTDDPIGNIGSGAAANHAFLVSFAGQIRSFFGAAEQVRVNIAAQDQQFTEALFNARVDAIAADITNQDTVFCYISTHGGFDPGSGHFLFTSDSKVVSRSTIFAKLQARSARQTILITDSCANITAGAASPPLAAGAAVPPYALYFLLFNYTGVVNINACSVREVSWYRTNNTDSGGGIFTRAFMRTAVEATVTDWATFITVLNRLTLQEGTLVTGTQPQHPAQFDANGQQTQP